MACQSLQTAILCERSGQDGVVPESQKNSAAAGLQLFQVFSSTSALLGLSRSCDYAATNGNLNALINWRRTSGMHGQSNMWGEILGTGLAGSGTGAAGNHGAAPGETIAVQQQQQDSEVDEAKKAASGLPPAFYQRDPASAEFLLAHKESSSPVDVSHQAKFANFESEGFVQVKGLQASLKTRSAEDKVLVIANLPARMPENHDGVCWVLKRGGFTIGPKHMNWTHELRRLDNVLIPWLDEPEKARMEVDYSVHCRLKGTVQLSQEQEKRQLTTVMIPGGQVTSARSCEPMTIGAGRWHDVQGLQQISVTNKGEKVLVICTMKYTALWSDELTRGRFSVFRDGAPLDAENYGLQSVRTLQSNLKRTLVMATVDDPAAGPHLYSARAVVTTEEKEPRMCQVSDDERQLALIRLPAEVVAGPARCQGVTVVDEDKWTEVAGLTITTTVQNPSDKVMVVYNVNFNPTGMNYESYFTLFRTSSSGAMRNLGGEDQGMWSVASSATASSEYPVGMFTDTPGAGTHTYTVHARTRRCDHLTEAPAVEVGPDGSISAILLSGRSTKSSSSPPHSLIDQMAEEMASAKAEA